MSITFTDDEWEQIENVRQAGMTLLKKAEDLERQMIIRKRAEEFGIDTDAYTDWEKKNERKT